MIPPKGHKLVPRSTPLHVYQLMMQLLIETFKTLGDSDYPYRNLAFDTTYNKESLKAGTKPIIITSCGDASTQPIVLQDLATAEVATFNAYRTSLVSSSVIYKVISPNKTEVEVIANEVFNFLTSCRVILPKLTTIRHISSISMSAVNKVYRDMAQYYVQCSMSYEMQYLWRHLPAQQLLEEATAIIELDYTPVEVRVISSK